MSGPSARQGIIADWQPDCYSIHGEDPFRVSLNLNQNIGLKRKTSLPKTVTWPLSGIGPLSGVRPEYI